MSVDTEGKEQQPSRKRKPDGATTADDNTEEGSGPVKEPRIVTTITDVTIHIAGRVQGKTLNHTLHLPRSNGYECFRSERETADR